LCHIAFGSPVLTCRQRAEQLRRQKPDFFEQYGAEAREILETLLDKYAEDGIGQLKIPGAFKVNKEFEKYGNVSKIAQHFGGADQLREAFKQLQILLYTA
jgi:type I restriction enzyme R subunit